MILRLVLPSPARRPEVTRIDDLDVTTTETVTVIIVNGSGGVTGEGTTPRGSTAATEEAPEAMGTTTRGPTNATEEEAEPTTVSIATSEGTTKDTTEGTTGRVTRGRTTVTTMSTAEEEEEDTRTIVQEAGARPGTTTAAEDEREREWFCFLLHSVGVHAFQGCAALILCEMAARLQEEQKTALGENVNILLTYCLCLLSYCVS